MENSENDIPESGSQIIGVSTVLLGVANLQKLLRSLKENPKLIGRIRRFSFPCDYENADVQKLQRDFHILLSSFNLFSHENGLYTVNQEHENHQNGESRDSSGLFRKLSSGNIDQRKLFEKLDVLISGLDTEHPHCSTLESLQDMPSISLPQNGFRFLQNLPNGVKLMPSSLSISHEHSEELEKPGNSSNINFKILHSKIDISQLSNLTLDLNCTHQCLCIPRFFEDFETYLDTEQRDFCKLSKLNLILHHEDWLDATEFLETVITPVTGVIAKMRSLHTLSLSLSVETFKLYTQDGMSPSRLNLVNSGILKVVMQAVENSSIKELAFPDLFTLFFYYKPQFYQSVLHTCQCNGCKNLLSEVKRRYLPIDDEDVADDESGFFVVIGFVLDKLRRERKLLPCGKREYVLHTGTRGILESSFGKKSVVENENYHEVGRNFGGDFGGDCDCDSDAEIDKTLEEVIEFEMENEIDFDDDPHLESRGDLSSLSFTDFSDSLSMFEDYLAVSESSSLQSEKEEKARYNSHTYSANSKKHDLDPGNHGVPAKNNNNSDLAHRFRSEDLFDEMVTTYILHQTRPLLEYVSGMLPQLEKLDLHGIHFQRSGERFSSVFDTENFPNFIFQKDLNLAPGLDSQPDTTYGAWTFT